MKSQASQQHQQRGRMPRSVMVMSCAGVIASLLIWAPSSVGGAHDNSASGPISAVPVQAAGPNEASADKKGGIKRASS